MKKFSKNHLLLGALLLFLFLVWTILITLIDVEPVGPNGSYVGFASFNSWFHELTGVHMLIYTVTDWLGLVPIIICLCFAGLGFAQWIKRKNMFRVDADILLLGAYYILVIAGYSFFEMVPVNYRPILISGYLEASYPSSTTLLVLSVLPTLKYQVYRRVKNRALRKAVAFFVAAFSCFMVIGRLVSGVHWFTDIVGGVLLSTGLYCIYEGATETIESRGREKEHGTMRKDSGTEAE